MFIKVGQYYYNNPLFYGEDWCLRITDDDVNPLLVLKSKAKTAKAARASATAIAKAHGIKAKIIDAYTTTATFPPSYDGVHGAWAITLQLKEELPLPLLVHAVTTNGRINVLPEGSACVKVHQVARRRQAAGRADGGGTRQA